MPRWNPDAQDRLVAAARRLFREQGYEAVTVNDIAEAAGLTRRSFFRYFPDKREVLFAGSRESTASITRMMGGFDADLSAKDAVMQALSAVGEFLLADVPSQALRQELIDASPELQERERTKLSNVATAVAAGLVHRGVPPAQARTLGVIAAGMFHSAYLRSIRDRSAASFAEELERSRSEITLFFTG